MEYYQYILSIPFIFITTLSISMLKDYIQVSYIYNKEKDKIN